MEDSEFADYDGSFTKYYHNNETFTVIRKDDVRKECYKCWHCNQQFESMVPKQPDLYMYDTFDKLLIHYRGLGVYVKRRIWSYSFSAKST